MKPAALRHVDVAAATNGQLTANVVVAVADAALARALEAAVTEAIRAATPPVTPKRIVRLRTRARLERLGPERIRDAVVVVSVRSENARRLPTLVDAIRSMDPAGVQLVWNGDDPPRAEVEASVFAVLERARSTPSGAPVVLAKTEEPAFSLGVLAEERARRVVPKEAR